MLKVLGYFLFGAILVLLDGCSNSDTISVSGLAYFPLHVGNYQIYQVSETNIQHTFCTDTGQATSNYQLKVLVYDSVRNAEGSSTYLIHRYTRADSTQSWADLDTWSARVTSTQVIVNEGNTSYVKLIFPLVNNSKWNGNLFNNLGVDDYHLTNLNQSYQITNGNKYATTLTVVQSDNEDFFVFNDKRIEIYAPALGLIYKETTQLTYFQDPCYGQQKVKSGIVYSQSLIRSGHE